MEISVPAFEWTSKYGLLAEVRHALAYRTLSGLDYVEPDDEEPAAPTLGAHKFTLNHDTQYIHIIANRSAWEHPKPGRTLCGWDYVAQQGTLHHTVPRGAFRCGKCAKPAIWQQAMDASDSD